jgi:cytochrome P450
VGVPDLADPLTHAGHDLRDLWRRLQTEDPVYWHEPGAARSGFWVLSRYDDIVAAYRDSRRYSSAHGNVLASLLAGGDTAGGRMVPVTDGPHHAAMRKLLSSAFAPRYLEPVERRVRAETARLLADAVERGRCDFARDVAAHVPVATICGLLGVPAEDQPFLLGQTSAALSSDVPGQPASESWRARNEILLYFTSLTQERRKAPRDDVISLLANSTAMTPDEAILNCYSLIIGGDETTRLSMVGAVAAFVEHPDQWELLRRGEVTVEAAVEEVLRWTTPAMHAGRTATEDVTLHGRHIRAGDIVTLWNTSANRDESVFPGPDRFHVRRSPNRHLAFGYGAHFCLGAALARIELAALLDALRTTVSRIEPAGAAQRIYSTFLTGYSSLPVTLEP